MTFKPAIWRPIAFVLSVINLVAVGLAAGAAEPWHAAGHATLALAFSLTASGLLTAATALPGAVAMVAAFTGMFIGQAVRSRMQPDVFRRWFLIAMILLGLYLAGNAIVRIHG